MFTCEECMNTVMCIRTPAHRRRIREIQTALNNHNQMNFTGSDGAMVLRSQMDLQTQCRILTHHADQLLMQQQEVMATGSYPEVTSDHHKLKKILNKLHEWTEGRKIPSEEEVEQIKNKINHLRDNLTSYSLELGNR